MPKKETPKWVVSVRLPGELKVPVYALALQTSRSINGLIVEAVKKAVRREARS